MKNRIEQFPETNKDEIIFTITEKNFGTQLKDQELDCWGNLWQQIKTKGSRFLRQGE